MAATPENTRNRNDTSPPFRHLLQDRHGPVDLTAATDIKLFLKGGATPTLVTITCTADDDQDVDPPVEGVIENEDDHPTGRGWVEGPIDTADLSVEGDYEGQVQVTDPTGKTTFPNKGYIAYTIQPDLDDA